MADETRARFQAPVGMRDITKTYTEQPNGTFTNVAGGAAAAPDSAGLKNIETFRGGVRSMGNVVPPAPATPTAVPVTEAPQRPALQGINPMLEAKTVGNFGTIDKYNELLGILSDPFARNMYKKSQIEAIGHAVAGASGVIGGAAKGYDTGQNAAEASMFGNEQQALAEAAKTTEMAKARAATTDLGYAQLEGNREDRALQRQITVANQEENRGIRKTAQEMANKAFEYETNPNSPKNLLTTAQIETLGNKGDLRKAQVERAVTMGAPLSQESIEKAGQGLLYKPPVAPTRKSWYNPGRYIFGRDTEGQEGGWVNPSTGKFVRPKEETQKKGLRNQITGGGKAGGF